MSRSEIEEIKELMENREIKEVKIIHTGELFVRFKDGGHIVLSQNPFREWCAKGR